MAKIKLKTAVQWYDAWEEATNAHRERALRDRQYYDGDQWTDEEIKQLNQRGQAPVVTNRIAPKINSLLGIEMAARQDPKAIPRTPKHEDEAMAATDALRFVADASDFDSVSDSVNEHMAIEGFGAMLAELEDGKDGPEIKLRSVPYDRLWYDPHSMRSDFADARYLGIVSWLDIEDAKAIYEQNKNAEKNADKILESAINEDKNDNLTHEDKPRRWGDSRNNRVKVSELYYRARDKKGIEHWYTAHYSSHGWLVKPRLTGIKDDLGKNVCPLVIQSAYTSHDGERYGVVRPMVSPQDEVNKRRSKSLSLLTYRGIIAEEGAIEDPQSALIELSKGVYYIEKKPGMEVQVTTGADLAQGQFQLLQEAKAEIDNLGPNSALAGTGAGQSGREVIARQEGANLELTPFRVRARRFRLRCYRLMWQMVRQFWRTERWLRVRDDKEKMGFRFVPINRSMTRAERIQDLMQKGVPAEGAAKAAGIPDEVIAQSLQMAQQAAQQGIPTEAVFAQLAQLPVFQETVSENDIAHLDVDIILDDAPDAPSVQHEQWLEIMRFNSQNPGSIPLKPLLESSQLRIKRDLIESIEERETQQTQAAQQQQQMLAQMQQLQQQMEQQRLQMEQQRLQIEAMEAQANIIMRQAEARKDDALAEKYVAEANQADAGALKKATEAGEKMGASVAQIPGILG